MHGDVTEDADGDESDDGKRQYVVADEERDEDVSRRLQADRHARVQDLRAFVEPLRTIRCPYRRVDDRHADPDGANRQQDIASSSKSASQDSRVNGNAISILAFPPTSGSFYLQLFLDILLFPS